MAASTDHGVFIIYTGGTIGSLPKDPDDPLSPLVPQKLEKIIERLPNYNPKDRKILFDQDWIRLGAYSWPSPIDSSNVRLDDWKELARLIKANYDEYEGFVILHGTDTLAYTASALPFMLENLNKPVIVTGSQLPIGRTRSDAVQNLVTSIEIAAAKSLGRTVVPEVCVFFRDHLFRGCRTTKLSASSFDAFYSPNYPPLAKVGEHIEITNAMKRTESQHLLRTVEALESNIASIDIFPGMNTQLLKNLLNTQGLRGVVLQTFGTGNAPTTPEFLDTLDEAIRSGKMILDITQCRSGEVELGLYDVSAGLLSLGVISGMDMTIEAALTKMFVILGSEPLIEVAADKMQINLKGEQKRSIFNLHFPPGEVAEDEKPVTVQMLRPMVWADRYDPARLENALFRIMGLRTTDRKKGRIEFKAYMDLPDANESTPEDGNPHFIGKANKKYDSETGAESVFLPVTEQVRSFVEKSGHTNTVTIVSTGGPFKWDKLNIAVFTP